MSKKRKYKAKKVIRCTVCSHMFEVSEENTYLLYDKEMYYCTNCGADKSQMGK